MYCRRYRTCRMNQEKDNMRYGSFSNPAPLPDLAIEGSSSTTDQTDFESVTLTPSSAHSHISSSVVQGMRYSPAVDRSSDTGASRNSVSGPVSINIPWLPPTKSRRPKDNQRKLPQPYKPYRTLPPRWTKEEDENLIKGHKKYGFSWTAITKDPGMQLTHRLGAQVRDRFRLKFSELYQAAPPKTEIKKTKSQPKHNSIKEELHAHSSLDVSLSPKVSKRRKAESRMNSLEARKTPQAKISHAALSPKPYTLPAELEITTRGLEHHHGQASRYESTRDVRSDLQGQPQGLFPEILGYSDERSRQSSVAADDARHLGILGLLNQEEEEEEVSRLPPFKYSYEDWGEGSVTLPPLLWEDMAARPMFDLE